MKETVLDWMLIAWSALLEVGVWLDEKSAEWPWLSWIIHAVIGVPIALQGAVLYLFLVWIGFLPVIAAGISAAVTHYFWRELEQIAHRLMRYVGLVVLDHVMDVAAPAVFLYALGRWVQ